MSSRGRGRGAFGRGRGGPPDIKDEDGQYVTRDVAGPPPIYPVISRFLTHWPKIKTTKRVSHVKDCLSLTILIMSCLLWSPSP